MGSLHQGLADHPEKEDGNDVCEDDGEDTGGAGCANVVVGKLTDQVGQVLVAVPATDDLDLRVKRQMEDCLDHHHDRDGATEMGQGQEPELRPGAGTVEDRGFFLLLVLGLQRGHEDQDREGRPLPCHHDDDRIGRGLCRSERNRFELRP